MAPGWYKIRKYFKRCKTDMGGEQAKRTAEYGAD